MGDLIAVVATLAFFAVALSYAVACARLGGDR
jgi:hypothetical protein